MQDLAQLTYILRLMHVIEYEFIRSIVFPRITLPANSSRHFSDQSEAIQQPTGQLQICYNSASDFFFNGEFDYTLLRYDLSYCTKDDFHMQATETYFLEFINKNLDNPLVIDIGCGQGEFVDFVKKLGYDALGFDPVNTRKEEFFSPDYFYPSDNRISDKHNSSNIIFVMRCVLPHIADPIAYLDALFSSFPKAQVLLEYQNLEWIIAQQVWYQFSHDHINYFSKQSFHNKFKVIAQGEFSNAEWSHILLEQNQQPSLKNSSGGEYLRFADEIVKLFGVREHQMQKLAEKSCPIAIYGAAGKGIVFGFTLKQFGIENVIAIDASPERQGKFMDVSGIPITSLEMFSQNLNSEIKVLVMNPTHYIYARDNIEKSISVLLASG